MTHLPILEWNKYCMPQSFREHLYKQLIFEGGAFGHLLHPYEDNELTFKDLFDLIEAIYSNNIEFAQEKTDGVNIMFSMIDGHVRFARNAGHLKNFGANSMTFEDFVNKFSSHPFGKSLINGAKEIVEAIEKIKPIAEKIFKNGKVWASAEIIHPDMPITVEYGAAMVLIHGTLKVDENGNFVSNINKKNAQILGKAIKEIEKNSEFYISDIPLAELSPKVDHAYKRIAELKKELNSVGGNENWTIRDYKEAKLRQILKKYNLPKELEDYFVKRIIDGIKSPNLTQIKKAFPEYVDVISEINKNEKEFMKKIMTRIKMVFVKIGVDVLSTMKNLLAVNPDKTVQKIQKNIEKVKKLIQNINDDKTKQKALDYLKALEEIDYKVLPTEGITFFYKGKFYKLTGSFAIAHQLTNIIRQLEFGF